MTCLITGSQELSIGGISRRNLDIEVTKLQKSHPKTQNGVERESCTWDGNCTCKPANPSKFARQNPSP